jgi:hypothetical protein
MHLRVLFPAPVLQGVNCPPASGASLPRTSDHAPWKTDFINESDASEKFTETDLCREAAADRL